MARRGEAVPQTLIIPHPHRGLNLAFSAQVFGPAFRRQSRWSMPQPTPDLGEDEAEDREVDRFYKFWFAFKSWREFPHPDEEDVEQAETREDRCADNRV